MNLRQLVIFAIAGGLSLTWGTLARAEDAPKTRTLTLKQAIILATGLEPTLQKAKGEHAAALAAFNSTWAAFLPRIDGHIELGTVHDRAQLPGEGGAPVDGRDHNVYHGDLTITMNLFRGWGDVWKQRAAGSAAERAQAVEQQIASGVARDVGLAYFKIQVEQRKRAAEVEARQLREKQLEEVRNRAAAGRANRLDLLRAEFTYKQRLPEIRRLETGIREQVLRLMRMIGGELDVELILADDMTRAYQALLGEKLDSVAELYQRALQANGELRKIKAEHDREEQSLLAEGATHWPSADLILSAGTDAFVRDEISDPSAQTYKGLIRISVPLFSGLSSWSEVRERRLKVAALRYDEQALKNKLFEDVNHYLQQALLAQEQMAAEEANVLLATESIRQAELLYRNGAAQLSDVLDAYTQKVDARRAQATAMYSRIESALWLQHLTGGFDVSFWGES